MKTHAFFRFSLIILLSVTPLLIPNLARAQTSGTGQSRYYIYGTVYGENFNTPLFGADVALVNKKTFETFKQPTNSAGGFAFYVYGGTYTINVIARGYQVDNQTVILTNTPINTYFILKKLNPSTSSPIENSSPIGDGTENAGENITGSPGSTTNTSTTTSGTNSSGSNTSTSRTGKTSATSNCVETKVGEPNTSPSPPAECANQSGGGNDTGTGGSIGNGGKWRFPLKSVDAVGGIATEMAVYAGGFSWGGHYEHAGLDIGTPGGNDSPVYAITAGTVIERTDASCPDVEAGCSVQIQHKTDEFISRYTHIDIDPSVYMGKVVNKGDIIGHVHIWPYPNDHLHFELRKQDKLDIAGQPVNVNPRNYYPELQRFPISEGYNGNVRAYTANQGYPWQNDGREFGNEYLNHPPCTYDTYGCWAH